MAARRAVPKGQRGVALVEMALAAPILIIVSTAETVMHFGVKK